MDWKYPVLKPAKVEPSKSGNATVDAMIREALTREAAYEILAEDDRRPLLIMRECDSCKGSDDALLSRSLANDTTILLSKWFRCVKLPLHVLEEDHPFRNVFEVKRPPHVILARWDGSEPVAFAGDQSQGKLWKAMYKVLDREYDDDPKKVIRQLQKIYAQYDRIDGLKDTVKDRIEAEVEKRGPRSNKLPKLRKKLASLDKERDELIAQEEEIRKLALHEGDPR
ncbi:MAG: hypothetical protein ACYTG5_07155 [Planctomycetota bacterium]|jgi:hypothetical protein